MAKGKRPIQEEVKQEAVIEPVIEQSADPSEITATMEAIDSNEAPVTVTGKKIQPNTHLAKRKTGVSLRNIQTGVIISSNLDERTARVMVRDYPTKVEIV
jgi:hypothetical protein